MEKALVGLTEDEIRQMSQRNSEADEAMQKSDSSKPLDEYSAIIAGLSTRPKLGKPEERKLDNSPQV